MNLIISLLPLILLIFIIARKLYSTIRWFVENSQEENDNMTVRTEPPSDSISSTGDREEKDSIQSRTAAAESKVVTEASRKNNTPGTDQIAVSRQERDQYSTRDSQVNDIEPGFEKDDIVRGFIFKQLLDKPRAKNPYRPPYRS